MNNSLRHKLPRLAALARTRPFRLWLARCESSGYTPTGSATVGPIGSRTACSVRLRSRHLHIIDTLERQRLSGKPVLLILHSPLLEPRLQTLLYSYMVWFRTHHKGFQTAVVCPDRRWLRCKDSPPALQALHASAGFQLHTCGWQTPDRLRGLSAEHIYCWGLPAPAVTPILRAVLPQLSMTAHSLLIIHTITPPTDLDPRFWPILTPSSGYTPPAAARPPGIPPLAHALRVAPTLLAPLAYALRVAPTPLAPLAYALRVAPPLAALRAPPQTAWYTPPGPNTVGPPGSGTAGSLAHALRAVTGEH